MAHAIKVRGRLSDPRHIELDEPVNDLAGQVDVVVSAVEIDDDRRLATAASALSEPVLKRIWDNPDDDVYDKL